MPKPFYVITRDLHLYAGLFISPIVLVFAMSTIFLVHTSGRASSPSAQIARPHLADIRMNWIPMRIWRWLADATVYLLLFISASGVYLWAVLRSERRIGIALLLAGAFSFFGTVYALIG